MKFPKGESTKKNIVSSFKGDLPATPKDMGRPYGKRDPYHYIPFPYL